MCNGKERGYPWILQVDNGIKREYKQFTISTKRVKILGKKCRYLFVKILSISDKIVPILYSAQVRSKFSDIDFVIACGDLPYYYQEFIISSLDKPLFFVRGNHDPEVEYSLQSSYNYPLGGTDLHKNITCYENILIGGIEGSIRYKKEGRFQYTQSEMWFNVVELLPRLLFNRVKYGRFLDIFVSHAPPWKIHDKDDLPHQGIKAFRWFIETFQPRYHFHGHTHVYRSDTVIRTLIGNTEVINTYGCQQTEIEVGRNKEDGGGCERADFD